MENLTVQQVTLIVAAVMLAISLVTALISLWLERDRSRQWFGDWFQGVSTEMIGAVVTTIFFTFIVGAVQEQQASSQLKAELIAQLGSAINAEAVRAAEQLAQRGWIKDGSLRGVDLSFADLSGALLFVADLEGASLFSAVLQNADLTSAALSQANLQGADLKGAALEAADLRAANLEAADLKGANLKGAALEAAILLKANLDGADLSGARFDRQTVLPDGAAWTPETDMARFSDSSRPDFWRPTPGEGEVLPWWAAGE